jgi:hypothetical protein
VNEENDVSQRYKAQLAHRNSKITQCDKLIGGCSHRRRSRRGAIAEPKSDSGVKYAQVLAVSAGNPMLFSDCSCGLPFARLLWSLFQNLGSLVQKAPKKDPSLAYRCHRERRYGWFWMTEEKLQEAGPDRRSTAGMA